MSGYTVDPGALYVTAEGIQAVLGELCTLGINGESGSPIENVALSRDDVGSDILAGTSADALQRAHYALRSALHDATQVVGGLRNVQASYQRTENHMSTLFAQISRALNESTDRLPGNTPPPRPVRGTLSYRLAGGEH